MKKTAFNRKYYAELYDFGDFDDLGYFEGFVTDEGS